MVKILIKKEKTKFLQLTILTMNKNSWESHWGLTFNNIYLSNITIPPNIYEEIRKDFKNCKNEAVFQEL